MGDVDEYVLRDRLQLADEGVVSVVIVIDAEANRLYSEPVVEARGFIYESEMNHVKSLCQKRVKEIADELWKKKKPLGAHMMSDDIRDKIQKSLFEYTRRRPVVIVSVVAI